MHFKARFVCVGKFNVQVQDQVQVLHFIYPSPPSFFFSDLPEKSACTLPKNCCSPRAISPRSVALPSPKHNCLRQFEQQRASTLQEK